MRFILVVFCFFYLSSVSAKSETFIYKVDVNYKFSEVDSLMDAKRFSLEEAIMKASAEAGIYHYTEKNLQVKTHEKAKQFFQTVAATIANAKVLQEDVVTNDGWLYLKSKYEITIDTGAIERRMDVFDEKNQYRVKVEQLLDDNDFLRKRVFLLSEKLKKGGSEEDLMAISKERSEALKQMLATRGAVVVAIDASDINRESEKSSLDIYNFKSYIDKQLVAGFVANANLKIEQVQVVKLPDGMYDVSVDVSWLLSTARDLEKRLDKEFDYAFRRSAKAHQVGHDPKVKDVPETRAVLSVWPPKTSSLVSDMKYDYLLKKRIFMNVYFEGNLQKYQVAGPSSVNGVFVQFLNPGDVFNLDGKTTYSIITQGIGTKAHKTFRFKTYKKIFKSQIKARFLLSD